MAFEAGCQGVVLSNHGGRQLDFARSGIEVLVEVVTKLKELKGMNFPNPKFEIYVDGGVRRATDVLKAIALGATAGRPPPFSVHCITMSKQPSTVGIGRPFLYAYSAYGQDGIDQALQILNVRKLSFLCISNCHDGWPFCYRTSLK